MSAARLHLTPAKGVGSHRETLLAGAVPAKAFPIRTLVLTALLVAFALSTVPALGHGVGQDDGSFLASNEGLALVPFAYLGAKHMFTGYDHLLFLAGVIFFLYRLRDVGLYVSLFALGHSITLIIGVLANLSINAFIVDAIIGLSVAYKAFDNLGGFRALGWNFDQKKAVLVFGLFHGFGLATKLQPLGLSEHGLLGNLLAFNVGVEVGQFAALALILLFFNVWRASGQFVRHAYVANTLLMIAGFVLAGFQLTGYFAG